MIDTKELRLGNFIKPNFIVAGGNTPLKVLVVAKSRISCTNGYGAPPYAFNPITITDGWLLKLGFVEEGGAWICPDDPNICLSNEAREWYSSPRLRVVIQGYSIGHVPYIHSLQNLCFALTGKDLII